MQEDSGQTAIVIVNCSELDEQKAKLALVSLKRSLEQKDLDEPTLKLAQSLRCNLIGDAI